MDLLDALSKIASMSGLLIVPLLGFVIRVSNRLSIIETHLLYLSPSAVDRRQHVDK